VNPGPRNSFLRGFLSTILFGLISVAVINIIVDPFYRFDLFTIQGINAQRFEFSGNVRAGKVGAVCRIQPQTIIMGTSRAEVGLDPKHPAFEGRRTYNLAMAAMGIGELELTLRHAINASPDLKQAVVAIDFLMFNAYREAVVFGSEVLDFDRSMLILSDNESCLSKFAKDANRLIGFSGLKHVHETLKVQRPVSDVTAAENGQEVGWWASLYDNQGFRGGYYEVATNALTFKGKSPAYYYNNDKTQEYYYVSKIWRAGPQHRYCFVRHEQPNTIDVFRRLVMNARAANLDVRFVINPIHANMLLALQESGLWPQYEDWKRSLVKVLAEESQVNGTKAYPLWDFSGINSITTEDSPPETNLKEPAKWYWEPSHYKKATGDLILDRVFDYHSSSTRVPKDFGIVLTTFNIDAWLTKTRVDVRHYAETNLDKGAILKKELAPLFVAWTGANCGDDIQLVDKAASAVRNGNLRAAYDLIAKALALRDHDKKHAAELGVPYREPDIKPLIFAALKGEGLDPALNTWQAYQERANERMAAGDTRGALRDYTAALRESVPANPALYFLRGKAYLYLKDYGSAEVDFDSGLKIDPKNIALYFLRGSVRLERNDFVGAAADFEAGLQLDPSNIPLQSMLKEAKSKGTSPITEVRQK
jgi:hypothetical protein